MFSSDLAGTTGALILVVALIVALRFGNRFLSARRGSPNGTALATVAQLALDNRRRLQLVRCGDAHVLVLSGGTTDVLLPWPATAAAAAGPGPSTTATEWRPFAVGEQRP